MKVELYYDSERFIFNKGNCDIGHAKFSTLRLLTVSESAGDISDMEWLMTDYMPGEVLTLVGVKGTVLGPLRPFTHEVTLHGCGNPDRQQYADIAPKKTVRVCSVVEAGAVALDYQRNYDMGGGNCGKNHGKVWLLPQSMNGKRKLVGHVSYNGNYETVAERKAFDKMMKEKYASKKTA